jgi:1-acyl-sn-glycerol-3-phosphate acyltransferase
MSPTVRRTPRPHPAPGRIAGAASRVGAWLYGAYVWLLLGMLLLGCSAATALLRDPARGRPLARAAARLLFRLAGMPLSASGLERLPDEAHILLVNHTSFLDGIALSALLPARPGYAFVVRQQFPIQRLLCPLLRGLGAVVLAPAGSGSHAGNALLIAHALRHGCNLVVFPEAGFVPEAGLRRFHSGAFLAALRTGAPLALAGLRGARLALRPRTWLPQRAAIALEIGGVLRPSREGAAGVGALMRSARQAMLPLCGEPEATRERRSSRAAAPD